MKSRDTQYLEEGAFKRSNINSQVSTKERNKERNPQYKGIFMRFTFSGNDTKAYFVRKRGNNPNELSLVEL